MKAGGSNVQFPANDGCLPPVEIFALKTVNNTAIQGLNAVLAQQIDRSNVTLYAGHAGWRLRGAHADNLPEWSLRKKVIDTLDK